MVYYLSMDTKQINPVKRAYRQYCLEFAAAMGAYVVVIFIRGHVFDYWQSRGWLQSMNLGWVIALSLLPMLPVCLIFWAILRFLRGMDELGRRIMVDSLAIAGGMTAMLAATYGFIEGNMFPHLSAWWTYAVFMMTWLVASRFVMRRYK
jgi:hypothetical protein